MNSLACWQCGADISDTPRPISRHATCPQCFNELHCCRACRHFDPQQTLRCGEDRADPPLQKENANFCEFFTLHPNPHTPASASQSQASRDQLDALFDTPASDDPAAESPDASNDATSTSDTATDARKALEDLFKK